MIKKRLYSQLAFLIVLGCLTSPGWCELPIEPQHLPSFTLSPKKPMIEKELFSLNIVNLEYGAIWPTIPFFSWRNFHSAWAKLEIQNGKWDFTQLDKDIALAEKHNVQILLELVSMPSWETDNGKIHTSCQSPASIDIPGKDCQIKNWENYVRTVAKRYRGRVHFYELWNEPNVKRFFSGTITDLVELNRTAYMALKEIDPSITVVSSALTRLAPKTLKYLDEFFLQGGGQYADIISHHFYPAPAPPEEMLEFIQSMRTLMERHDIHKPLWNTETGWNILNHDRNKITEKWAGDPLTDEMAVAYMARAYILSWASGIERLYWYAWGHRSMGMTEHDARTPKAIAQAYAEIQNWLIGTRMKHCQRRQNQIWICEFLTERGNPQWIIWNTDKKMTFPFPKSWMPSQWKDLKGKVYAIKNTGTIEIGPVPLLVERKPS